jgi:predicted phosphodiesterase
MINAIRKSSELISKNIFRIQYVSDIHLEINHITNYESIVKPIAPYLALVGDIGHIQTNTYKPFFDYVSNEFEKVFYIPGNHEYYSQPITKTNPVSTFYQLNHQMKLFCDTYKNIHYLYRDSYKFDDFNVGIIGTPLWTPYFSSKNIYVSINDSITPEYANYLHQLDITYIDDRCRKFKNTNSKIVVLTHFLPSFSLIPNKYKDYPNKQNFASNSDFLFKFPINAWIYGHTHQASSQTINKTLTVTNPYGYKSQFQNNGFCNQMFVEFNLATNEEEDKPILSKKNQYQMVFLK